MVQNIPQNYCFNPFRRQILLITIIKIKKNSQLTESVSNSARYIELNYPLLLKNHGHNIMRIFDVLPHFPFTTSERKSRLLVLNWFIRVASRVSERLKTYDLGKLRKLRITSKLHGSIPWCPVFLPKRTFCQY